MPEEAGYRFLLAGARLPWAWNGQSRGSLMVGVSQVREAVARERLRSSQVPLALCSDPYRNLLREGRWTVSPADHAGWALRVQVECGKMMWARVQDWPCDPEFLAVTGMSEEDHQRRSVESLLDLERRISRVRWLPVLHGRDLEGYLHHVEMYREAGIDLISREIVGVGSLGTRRSDDVVAVLEGLQGAGISLHALGVGLRSIERMLPFLRSSSSEGWSTTPGAGQAEAESYRKAVMAKVREVREYESYGGILDLFGGEG